MSAKIRRLFKQMHWVTQATTFFSWKIEWEKERVLQRMRSKREKVNEEENKEERERKTFSSKEGVWVEFKMVPFYFLCRKMSRIMLINDFRFRVSRKTRSHSLALTHPHSLAHTPTRTHSHWLTHTHPHALEHTHKHVQPNTNTHLFLVGHTALKFNHFYFGLVCNIWTNNLSGNWLHCKNSLCRDCRNIYGKASSVYTAIYFE